MSISSRVWEIHAKYASCKACPLYRNRRGSIRGSGNTSAPVLFVLDRLDPAEVGGQFPGHEHRLVLESLLAYAGREVREFYITPVTGCPTRPPMELQRAEIVPLAKNPEVVKCGERVAAEIQVIQPRVVVACGQAAVRSLIPIRAPNVQTSAGMLVEAYVRGMHVDYPVPVMLTNSLQDLAKTDPQDPASPWDQTCQHILTALDLADQLNGMENKNG